MKLLLILAWRNLWRKKRRTFITVSSVLFAVVLAIALMSLIEGTREVMIDSIIHNSTGHLQVQDALYHDEPSMDHALEYGEEVKSALAEYSGVISYTVPRIQGFCLGAKEIGTRGVYVMGIVPEKEDRMNDLSSKLIEGEMFTDEDQYAVIAKGVADLLDLSVGDSIVLMGQGFQGMTAAGIYSVGGIVEFNLPEQNNTMVYLPLKEAQMFFAAPERLSSLILMVEDEGVVDELAENLRAELDDEWYAVKTWEELLPDAVAALEARDAQVKVFAWILYIVAGFGIFGTIMTMMYERLREFGILLSIGLKRTQLSAICLLETVFMSLLGVLCGVAVGYPIMYWLNRNPIPLKDELAEVMLDMGFEPVLPFSVAPDIFIYQGITIFFIALVVSLYPVKKVFRLDMISAARK
ncbi:MAG: ABC transporter permease [Marinilabiliales bacterium]|nr:MAG: ABC transporter permease [Marinilabiliales bacterium]